MKKLTCKKCGKVVEGYNQNHVEFLMTQHNLKHRGKTTDTPLKPQNQAPVNDNQVNNIGGKKHGI
jgi:hypothetical protein